MSKTLQHYPRIVPESRQQGHHASAIIAGRNLTRRFIQREKLFRTNNH